MVLLSSILSDFVRREMDSYEVIKDGVGTNGQKLQIWFQFSYLVTFCHCESEVPQLCLTLCNPMNCSPQAPLSIGFPGQVYWNGLPFPSPGDLFNPGIEPGYPAL